MGYLSKQEYIDAFKRELLQRDGSIQDRDLDDIDIQSVWRNPTADGGLRLTRFGYDLLTDNLNLESWGFLIDGLEHQMSANRILLLLDHYIDCPYHIGRSMDRPQVSVFNSKLATAIAIQGSISKFIQTREKRKNIKKRLTNCRSML